MVVCVTIVGAATVLGPVRRSGAEPGDVVFVTGPLGGGSLGRHLDPKPRIEEASLLIESSRIHSMIDVSDGLLADLGHILADSGGLGATLDADAIPIHEDAFILSRLDGVSPLEHALHDGEDFELCFTVPAGGVARLVERSTGRVALFRIGTIDERPGLRLREANGDERGVDPKGFDHFLA